MAIQRARAYIDGLWYQLAYNPETVSWQAEVIPTRSSYNQVDKYFPVSIEATNSAGDTVLATGLEFDWLKLRVRDKTVPSIFMAPDYENKYITTRLPIFVFNIIDDDPGVDLRTLTADIDGQSYSATITTENIENGYRVTYTSNEEISEGVHYFSVSVSDYDGNRAEKFWEYVIDVTPPELFISNPVVNYIVDEESVEVSGKAFDEYASPVKIIVSAPSIGEKEIETNADGFFSLTVPLNVGGNNISIKAVDSAGFFSQDTFYMIRMITDRTQKDVDAISRIMSIPFKKWQEKDKETYNKAIIRGSYDYTDINRVYEAVGTLDLSLRQHGIVSGIDSVLTTMTESDIITPTEATKYLRNITLLKEALPLPDGTPEVPPDMEKFTFQEANDIERILVLIDDVLYYINKGFLYSGEIFCGE